MHVWNLNRGDGVSLSTGQVLKAAMWYEIIKDDGERGPWRVTTRGYMHSVEHGGSELLGAHWHPESPGPHKEPHLHVPHDVVNKTGYFLAREPLHTGRFTFEGIVRMAINNFGAEPLCEDWDNRLLLAETPHKLYRSWHQTPAEAEARDA